VGSSPKKAPDFGGLFFVLSLAESGGFEPPNGF